MKSFRYSGFDPSGREVSGMITAVSASAGEEQVIRQGIFLTKLEENLVKTPSARAKTFSLPFGRSGRVKPVDLTMFIVQLASLIEAGMQLDRSLELFGGQQLPAGLKEVILALAKDVRTGVPLSEALMQHKKVFSELQIQMIHAGELSGQLDAVLMKLAEYSEKEETRRSQIKSALIYPVMLIFFALGAIGFIISFVVPRMTQVFKDLGTKLPWTTQLLILTGNFMSNAWPLVIGGLLALGIGIKVYTATAPGRMMLDRLLLRLPLIGPLTLKMSLSRFARAMSVMGVGGVGIMEALEVAAGASGNRVVQAEIMALRPEIREGKHLAQSLRERPLFPEIMTNLVAVGEETGNIDKMLIKVAGIYDFEVDTGLRRLLSLLEPVLIVFMGSVIAFIVISILVPIFRLNL